MKCHEAQKWFSPYLDSELDKTKTFEVSQHLQSCASCARRFEAERRADRLMVESLSQEWMPQQVWSRIYNAVAYPSWQRRLLSPASLAMAACLILVITAFLMSPRNTVQARPWLVTELARVTEVATAFPISNTGISDAQHKMMNRFGISFQNADPRAMLPHHDLKLVSITPQQDQQGQTYYEVRLNCCNHPVLLVISDSDDQSLPEPLADIPSDAFDAGVIIDNTHLAVRKTGAFVVAAVSTHPVNRLLDRMASVSY